MHVHHIIASINEEIGGPAVSTTQLNRALNKSGSTITSRIHSIDYTRHGKLTDPDAGPFIKAGRITELTRGWNLEFQNKTTASVRDAPGIIHNHGCWMAPNRFACQLAQELDLPLLISPRGMLEPWSMDFRSNKKKLAWLLYEKRNLKAAHAFHATSKAEANSIRRLGFRQPIYLVPNGVHIAPAPSIKPDSLQHIQSPFFLFLSRVHPKKGIDLLLHSWNTHKNEFPSSQLVIAGPDLEGYRQTLEAQFPDSNQIIWTGTVAGDTKNWLLHHAAFLCLPTHSENFGIVVAEALAHGTPVLTTDQTPWKHLSEKKCGWVTPPEQEVLTRTLHEALSTPPDQLAEMGSRGSCWMEKEFTWNRIADSMQQVYLHLSGSGPAPDFLIES